jgi:hypothetical protein
VSLKKKSKARKRHIKELVESENGINFTGNAEIAIVLTDREKHPI